MLHRRERNTNCFKFIALGCVDILEITIFRLIRNKNNLLDNYYLAFDESQNDLDELSGYSTTYRIAVGPNQGRKVFTLQTIQPSSEAYN